MLINKIIHSENFRERSEPIRYIIIHCSAGTPEAQINTLNNLKLSVHYIIGRNGEITENLPPEKVAYHAGQSSWNKSEGGSLNGCSIGIELESPSLGQDKDDYTTKQISALMKLLKELTIAYKIRKENILGHSDIAPMRKPDPGVAFPWKKLYQNNLVTWYILTSLDQETDELRLLEKVGYDTTNLAATRYAFCRHYFPEEILIEKDIRKLLDNVYPADFVPKNYDKYVKVLRAVARSVEKERQIVYWYLKN